MTPRYRKYAALRAARMTLAEIAAECGVAEGTVKSSLYRRAPDRHAAANHANAEAQRKSRARRLKQEGA